MVWLNFGRERVPIFLFNSTLPRNSLEIHGWGLRSRAIPPTQAALDLVELWRQQLRRTPAHALVAGWATIDALGVEGLILGEVPDNCL